MVDAGQVFRRVFSWLPSPFASQSHAPVGAPRQFGSTEHLPTEAIAACVVGELRMIAHPRAARALSLCPQRATEADAQIPARDPNPSGGTGLRLACVLPSARKMMT